MAVPTRRTTLHNHLGHLLSSSLCSLRFMAIKELENTTQKRNAIMNEVVPYVKRSIGDPVLQRALNEMLNSLRRKPSYCLFNEQMTELQFTEYRFIQLLLIIFDQPICLLGVTCPKAISMASSLLHVLRSQQPRT